MYDEPEQPETDVLVRAFALAPECGSIEELKRRLIREGYLQVNAHLSGRQLRRELLAKLNTNSKHSIPKRV